MMQVLALAGDANALIADIRLRTPLAALCSRVGWQMQLKSFHDCRRSDLAQADVLIVQRGATQRAWRLQHAMQLRGGAVIYEIDDLLTDLPAHISNQAATLERKQWVLRCLSACDVVSVSTRRLGDELGQPQAYVTPNHAMPLGDAPLPPVQPELPVTLLFASMEKLATDFIYAPLCAVQGAGQGTGMQVVVMGPPGAAFEAAGVRVQTHPLMPRADFIAFARSLPNPVAVIPLEASRFAACKSAIKWFEYAEAGLPVLCSDVSPYREVVQNNETGRLIPNEAAAWQLALSEAIQDSEWRVRVAASARLRVREHHTIIQSALAWQTAILAAREKAKARGPLRPTMGWVVQDTLGRLLEEVAMKVRQLNRERLAKRKPR